MNCTRDIDYGSWAGGANKGIMARIKMTEVEVAVTELAEINDDERWMQYAMTLALKAQELLAREHRIAVRVVSMPSTTTFDKQDKAWRDQVLPAGVPRVAIEAGHPDGWYKYVGLDGAVVGLARFGESAPAGLLFKEFGFTVENVVNTVRGVLSK